MDIRTSLSIIPGPRIERGKKHLLADIPLLCVIAMIRGMEDVENTAFWGITRVSRMKNCPARRHPQRGHHPAPAGPDRPQKV